MIKPFETRPSLPAKKHASTVPSRLWITHLVLLAGALLLGIGARAQAPTSLQYPSPVVLSANVSNTSYLPTYSGAVTSFSISPALPSGMAFSTSTGAITGTPTVSSAATNYTITATNASGSSTFTMNLQVTKNYYNVNYDTLRFINTPATITAIRGTGKNVNDSILYKNVATVEGQQIDCIVRTKSLYRVYYFATYDEEAASGSGFSNNMARFFSPQLVFDSSFGHATFSFQFIIGGSFVSGVSAGIPVSLQKVKLNTYDIDGMDAAGSNQFYALSGFDSAELGNPTRVGTSFDTTSELTKFRSDIIANTAALVADSTRARLTYNNMGYFELRVGVDAGVPMDSVFSIAYYSVDFSPGPVFNPPAVPTAGPRIDLNTTLPGVDNYLTDCTAQMAFTGGTGQTNVLPVGGPTYRQLRLRFPSASIVNGSSEQLIVSGATAGGTIALSSSTLASAVTLGGVVYSVTGSTSGGIRSLVFKRTSGSFTLANAEALLDAFRYANIATTPTNGNRVFTVTLRDSLAQSPAAVFTATVRCASIAGNVFRDANGLSNNQVDSVSNLGQFGANGVYAVLVNTSNVVVSTKGVSTGGGYTFGRVNTGAYNVLTASTNLGVGTTCSTATMPAGYSSTGENLGAGGGNDGSVNGKLPLTIGSVSVTQANLGMQKPPVTANTTLSGLANPGGYNVASLASVFNITETDGTVDSIMITAFPTNANFFKVGNIYYLNPSGGICPPQGAGNCIAWPGSLKLPYSSVATMGVDPSSNGATSVAIPFKVMDNARMWSNSGATSTVTLSFVKITNAEVSGYIWHDVNGDGKKKSHENYLAFSAPGQQLYALLIQTSNTYSGVPTLYAATQVVATKDGYLFEDVPEGNDYEVRYTSLSSAPVPGTASSTIPLNPGTGWTCVTVTYKNDTVSYAPGGTTSPVISIANLTGKNDKHNFGMEQAPVADPKAMTASSAAFVAAPYTIAGAPTTSIAANSVYLAGATVKSLSGADPEDCATTSSCNTGKTFVIDSIRPNTLLTYNYGSGPVLVPEDTEIENFNVAALTIVAQAGQGTTAATALGFTYALADSSGIESAPVTYTLQKTTAPLAVSLDDFDGTVTDCAASLAWTVMSEASIDKYVVEHSTDGIRYAPVATLACCEEGGAYRTEVKNLLSENYFRLMLVNLDGTSEYSQVLSLPSADCGGATINVAPNPVADGRLTISGLVGGANAIRIFSSTGQLVHSANTTLPSETISTTAFAAGTYMVQISNASGTILKMVRVVKL